jgi:hypothetical protein
MKSLAFASLLLMLVLIHTPISHSRAISAAAFSADRVTVAVVPELRGGDRGGRGYRGGRGGRGGGGGGGSALLGIGAVVFIAWLIFRRK